jgi:hypothetical protein
MLSEFCKEIAGKKPHSQKLEQCDVCYGDTVTTEHGYTVSGSCPVKDMGPNHTVNSRIHNSKETFTVTWPSIGLQTNCGVSDGSREFQSATWSPVSNHQLSHHNDYATDRTADQSKFDSRQ